MEFTVQILGTSSALPIHGRFPTAQYLRIGRIHVLMDCGEGTQIQMSRYAIKRNKIDHIFISHLHGDHVYGLPGLLGSYNHFNRTHPLSIYGPPGLREFIQTAIYVTGARFGYALEIIELSAEGPGSLKLSNEVEVKYFPLKHRVSNLGYRFELRPVTKKLNKYVIEEYRLSIEQIRAASAGEDIFLTDGQKLINSQLTLPQPEMISYAFCSDTVYDPSLTTFVKGVDLLYHETTYLDDLEKEAGERMHSTLGQAITIASRAGAGRLLTGHYSSRYVDLDEFSRAASKADIPVIIGREGEIYQVADR